MLGCAHVFKESKRDHFARELCAGGLSAPCFADRRVLHATIRRRMVSPPACGARRGRLALLLPLLLAAVTAAGQL